MRALLSLFATLMMILSSNAQQKDYLRLPIEKASIGGVDCSEQYKSVKGFISFYQSKIGNFCMANVMPAKDTQSYGEISERNQKTLKDVLNGDTIYILDFLWNYENNYDDNSGVAKCHMNLLLSKTGFIYSLEIKAESGSVAQYEGICSGTINELLDKW